MELAPPMTEEELAKKADDNLRAIKAKTAALEAAQIASTSTSEPPQPEKKKRGRKKKEVVEREERERAQRLAQQISQNDYVPHRPTRQTSNADSRRQRSVRNVDYADEPRQCMNPDCIYEADRGSKYCSYECGMALARLRLVTLLPQRAEQHFGPTPSGPRTVEDEIKKRKAKLKKELDETVAKERKLVDFLIKLHDFVKGQCELKPLGTEESYDDNIYESCMICGQDISVRKFAKHIDLCWARSEKAMSFGAPEKGNAAFYCENFDSRTHSYCKRLKSLCPEHRKPDVEQGLKVCGYPQKWLFGTEDYSNVFSKQVEMDDPFGKEGCRTKKDACVKHHKWVPKMRGCIELEQTVIFQKCCEICAESNKLDDSSDWYLNSLSILVHKKDAATVIDKEEYAKVVKKLQATEAAKRAEEEEAQPSTSSYASESRETTEEKTDEDLEDTAMFMATMANERVEDDEEGAEDEEEMDVDIEGDSEGEVAPEIGREEEGIVTDTAFTITNHVAFQPLHIDLSSSTTTTSSSVSSSIHHHFNPLSPLLLQSSSSPFQSSLPSQQQQPQQPLFVPSPSSTSSTSTTRPPSNFSIDRLLE